MAERLIIELKPGQKVKFSRLAKQEKTTMSALVRGLVTALLSTKSPLKKAPTTTTAKAPRKPIKVGGTKNARRTK